MEKEIEELKAEIERQKQYVRAYKALMEFWKRQAYETDNMLDEIFKMLDAE